MYKILHLSDTHIKNTKEHGTYREIFNQLYDFAKKEKPDVIVHCGDLCHSKTNISPEYVDLSSELLNNLADIAPTIIIAGNHDQILKNSNRMDSIEPIVKALNNKNIIYLKNSGEYKFSQNLTFNCLAVSDRDNWTNPSNKEAINIALYHGSIYGSQTDLGWRMQETDDNVTIFDDFDFSLLGDIHKRQFLKKNIAYAGSLIQQNFGEDVEKGCLLWEITDKNSFNVKPINFKNPYPYVTIDYSDELDCSDAATNIKLRVILDKYYTRDEIEAKRDEINGKLFPYSIVFVEKNKTETQDAINLDNYKKLNLRDNNIQKELITEFLSKENLSQETIDGVLQLNDKYNLNSEIVEEIARNINWSLGKFQWDNLFNYKEKNEIDFDNLSGIIGIFGKNYSGKSSIIDSILYTLWNTTSKKIKRNFDIVNERKNFGQGKIKFNIEDNEYSVVRETEKTKKKSKGKIIEEGKTSVVFEKNEDGGENVLSLNGIDRNETDKNIKKIIGTAEDFCNISLSTQHGSLDFINKTSSERKEVLVNFLDLQVFERKHKPANQDANELKTLIKKLSGKDYTKLLLEAVLKRDVAKVILEEEENNIQKLKNEKETLKKSLSEIEEKLSLVQKKINSEELNQEVSVITNKIQRLQSEIDQALKTINELKENNLSLEAVLNILNIEELKEKSAKCTALQNNIKDVKNDKERKETSLKIFKKSAELVDIASCGRNQYIDCPFKKSALDSLSEIDPTERTINDLQNRLEHLIKEIDSYNPKRIEEHINKHGIAKEKLSQNRNKILVLEKEIAEKKSNILNLTFKLSEINTVLDYYEKNKDFYLNVKALEKNKIIHDKELAHIQNEILSAEKARVEAISQVAYVSQQIDSYNESVAELDKLNKEYSLYELFLRCVHNNGIPSELIKKMLPVLNEEMNKLLINIVGFNAYFVDDEGKLEIYIQHEGEQERSIEKCSGAEKSLVAMAIRLALVKCGSLPVSDVFILDEPATSLDSEHLESFVKVLGMIKSTFKTVLLITHVDALKDSVDKIIEIHKDEDNYAYIS